MDESLEVLPQGIRAAPEVYSPMSHGATRVRSMITNRPFLLEEPVSPVAQRLGATMLGTSQGTFSDPDSLQHSMAVAHVPSQAQEQLHHDWWSAAEAAPEQTVAEAAPAVDPAAAEAAKAAEEEAEMQAKQALLR